MLILSYSSPLKGQALIPRQLADGKTLPLSYCIPTITYYEWRESVDWLEAGIVTDFTTELLHPHNYLREPAVWREDGGWLGAGIVIDKLITKLHLIASCMLPLSYCIPTITCLSLLCGMRVRADLELGLYPKC